jgi:uncharacterized protein (DUF952 family)
MSETAYKVLTADQWGQFQANGIFHGAPIDVSDGYIHMSTAGQLEETISKHFAGQTELVIAEIDLTRFGETLKWEESRGGAMFPHLYAPLPRTAVVSVVTRPLSAPIPASLAKLRNVGKAALGDFALLEIKTVAQLSACEPGDLFTTLQARTGQRQDPCVWDVFAATIHQARTGEAQNWWAFTAERKSRQAQNLFPN